MEDVRGVGGMGAEPIDDSCHRRLPRSQCTAFPEEPTDAGIGVTVLAVVAHAQRRSIGHPQPPRSLDFKEESGIGVRRPRKFEAAPGEGASVDFRAIVIG